MTLIRCARSAILILSLVPAYASEPFPFGVELMLDSGPLYGSKRIPMIEIEEDGTAAIDLWCATTRAQVAVGDSSMSILAEVPVAAQCASERATGDQDLLTALAQVTNWRRNGDIVELSGATTLRFRLMTN